MTDKYFMDEKKVGSYTQLFDAYEISSSVSWEFPPLAIPGVTELVVSFIIERGGTIRVRPYIKMKEVN